MTGSGWDSDLQLICHFLLLYSLMGYSWLVWSYPGPSNQEILPLAKHLFMWIARPYIVEFSHFNQKSWMASGPDDFSIKQTSKFNLSLILEEDFFLFIQTPVFLDLPFWMVIVSMYWINSSLISRMQHKVNFKWSFTGLNSEFSFLSGFHTKVKEPSLSDYSPIAGGEMIQCILFSRVLALCDSL